jgi:hypothetical protein
MSNFYTETIACSPCFRSLAPCNDAMMLEPVTRAAVQAIIADLAAKGVRVVIGETYRSRERQQLLFRKGATKLRTVGVHHYGLACDLWIEANGEVDWHADYRVLGPAAKARGLVWGYDWGTPRARHTFRDIDHVQRCAVKDQARLFAGAWYPDAAYRPTGA